MRIKIPFPAFTMCEASNASLAGSEIEFAWLDRFKFPTFLVSTELGQCMIINFCDQKNFLRSGADEDGLFEYSPTPRDDNVPENQTRPYSTISIELGINAAISRFFEASEIESPLALILMIHSPFELPTQETQKFYLSHIDFDTFFVSPLIDRIDDSMISMEPQKYDQKIVLKFSFKKYFEA